MSLRYTIIITGPAYGTQQASSAYQFALALLAKGHQIVNLFFYQDGVNNANQLTLPASDEFDLVRHWQTLAGTHHIPLNVCVAAALRRGVIDEQESQQSKLSTFNLQSGFTLSGLGSLAESMLTSDRTIQF